MVHVCILETRIGTQYILNLKEACDIIFVLNIAGFFRISLMSMYSHIIYYFLIKYPAFNATCCFDLFLFDLMFGSIEIRMIICQR